MLVSLSQVLTLAVAPEIDPVTTSLNQYVPTPTVAAEPTVIVGAEKNPAPASVILIEVTEPPALTTAFADAGKFGDNEGYEIEMCGTVEYPTPPLVTLIETRPLRFVTIPQVAAAPVPPPPLIVIVGATVYPAPVQVIKISSIDVIPFLVVVIATALALVPPEGAVEIETVGVLVYPEPSLFKNICLIYPVPTVEFAVANVPDGII